MKILPLVPILAVLAAVGSVSTAAEKPKPRGLEVLVTADAVASPEGFRPKPGQPIHYVFNQARQSLGEPVAGVKLPDPAVVERAVVAELAKQGFVRTEVGGPMPDIFIVAMVGDANFQEPPTEYDDLEPYIAMVNVRALLDQNGLHGVQVDMRRLLDNKTPASDFNQREAEELVYKEAIKLRYRDSPRAHDKNLIENLVDATKVTQAVDNGTLPYSDAERIAWAAYEDRYYVSLNAYDAARWIKKQKVLLWRTSMLIDWRKNFAAELPTMLAQAGPLFGTDTAVPRYLDERDRLKAEVQIGDLKVVPADPAPATEAPAKK